MYAGGIDYLELNSGDSCYRLLVQLMEKPYIIGRIQQFMTGMQLPVLTDRALLRTTIFPVVARALIRASHKHFNRDINEQEVVAASESILYHWNQIIDS